MYVLIVLTLANSASLRFSEPAYELEPALPDALYTAFSCASSVTDYINYICTLCGADLAYSISLPDVSYLEGYYEAQKSEIAPVLKAFSFNLPKALSYGVAVTDTKICLSASDFQVTEDIQSILSYFVGIEAQAITVPEIFKKTEIYTNFMASRHNGKEFEYFMVGYDVDVKYKASDVIGLRLKSVYNEFQEKLGGYRYLGEAGIKGKVYGFAIETEYLRPTYEDFIVKIEMGDDLLLAQATNLVAPDSGCFSLLPPRGISSFNPFNAESLSLFFSHSQESNKMQMISQKLAFAAPDFAIAPAIALTSISAAYVIDPLQNTCGYEVVGLWQLQDLNISLTVYNNKDTMHMEANGVILNKNQLGIEEIETYFFDEIFPDDTKMFSDFQPSPPVLLQQLREFTIDKPRIQLYFEPEVAYSVYAGQPGVEVVSGRVAGVLCTVIHNYVDSLDELKDLGFGKVQNDVYYSGCDAEVIGGVMGSMYDKERTAWKSGGNVDISIYFNDYCENNAFCGLLQRYAVVDSDHLSLSGQAMYDTISIDFDVDDIKLSSGVILKEVGLSIENSIFGTLPMFIGSFYLKVDNFSVLRFEASISQGEEGTSAMLKSQSYDVWHSAFEIPQLTVADITLQASLSKTGEAISSGALASGFIGDACYDGESFKSTCLTGDVSMNLDFFNSSVNSFQLGIFDLDTHEFYEYFLGYNFGEANVNMPLACLEFPAGITVAHQIYQKFYLKGGVMFCGVYGELMGGFSGFNSGQIDVNVTLEDFYIAASNGKVTSAYGSLTVDRLAGVASSYIAGLISIWDVQTAVNFNIQAGFSTSLSGLLYSGLSTYRIDLTSEESSKITEAGFTATITLNDESTKALELQTQKSIGQWFDDGLVATESADAKYSKYTETLADLKAVACDPELVCPKVEYCTDQINSECKQYGLTQKCLKVGACKNSELVCADEEVICIKADPMCEGDCECFTTVSVCQKWEVQCVETSQDCLEKVIVKDESNCVYSVNQCVKNLRPELECKFQCDKRNEVLDDGQRMYQLFVDAYKEVKEDLEGFTEIQQMRADYVETPEIFKLKKVSAVKGIDKSGVGPYDFEFQAEMEVISIEEYDLEEAVDIIEWNFFNEIENELSVLQKTKAEVVKKSGGTLSEKLFKKSPEGLLEDNIDYTRA